MSDRIEPGDVVMVVRGHDCVLTAVAGIPFTVDAVMPADYTFSCSRCGSDHVADAQPYAFLDRSRLFCGVPLAWLKKFPPLSDRESLDEIMSAPVLPETLPA